MAEDATGAVHHLIGVPSAGEATAKKWTNQRRRMRAIDAATRQNRRAAPGKQRPSTIMFPSWFLFRNSDNRIAPKIDTPVGNRSPTTLHGSFRIFAQRTPCKHGAPRHPLQSIKQISPAVKKGYGLQTCESRSCGWRRRASRRSLNSRSAFRSACQWS